MMMSDHRLVYQQRGGDTYNRMSKVPLVAGPGGCKLLRCCSFISTSTGLNALGKKMHADVGSKQTCYVRIRAIATHWDGSMYLDGRGEWVALRSAEGRLRRCTQGICLALTADLGVVPFFFSSSSS